VAGVFFQQDTRVSIVQPLTGRNGAESMGGGAESSEKLPWRPWGFVRSGTGWPRLAFLPNSVSPHTTPR
jgi:hypothetical protein